MCLIALAWRIHPDYPLVVAANRDEFRNRPTRAAHWWDDTPGVLAGRDLEAGGTWLGITRNGRFAALTNRRDPARRMDGAPSRGQLVLRALTDTRPPSQALSEIAEEGPRYAGYNLLTGDPSELCVHDNTSGTVRALAPGLYGLSNAHLDTPWPKLTLARARLAEALASMPDPAGVLALLRDDAPAPDHLLPDTGVGLEAERRLSPAFLRDTHYGTRSSAMILFGANGEASLREWTWNADGALVNEAVHAFRTDGRDARTADPTPLEQPSP